MTKFLRTPLFQFSAGVAALTVLAALLIPTSLHTLFSTGFFMPHRHCYLDNPSMIWLQGLSDLSIGLAYVVISGVLAYLVYKARANIPFEWMFLAFGLFIFSCGCTHFMEVWTLWYPTYWLSGGIKAVTAVASIATAAGLAPLLPRVFNLIDTAKASEQRRLELEKAHQEMASLNQQLRELDQLKSRFFANVSHELRTPLTLILGHTEKLREGTNLTAAQQLGLGVLKRNGDVLLRQVNDLLDAAKLEAGGMELSYSEADLAQLVRRTCSNFDTLAHDRSIRLEVTAPGSLSVEADPEKLEQVLVNLLSNAFKFTPAGGQVRCSLRTENTTRVLEVADTGPGIPQESRASVFERFRQLEGGNNRRFGGTGLGLSIVKDLVELHRGSVSVDGAPDGGAVFTIRIPQHAPEGTLIERDQTLGRAAPRVPEPTPAAEEKTPPSPKDPMGAAGTEPIVLVVEDNPEMNQLIQDILAPEYRTVAARNGSQGLDLARSSPPDLILTDLMMPDVSGDQLLRQLRAEPAFDPVPVVILTARADDQVRVQLLREGAQDYLLKPFTREELRARAGNLITAKLSRQELTRAYSEMEAFSYSLAHDLRAPLRAIRSFARILAEEHSQQLGTEGCDFIQRIISSGDRLDRLVEDVLSYTRTQRAPLQMHPVDLHAFLRNLLQDRADFREPYAEVVLRIPMAQVIASESSLTQVAVNLLSNAVKFMALGSVPHIEIWTEPCDGMVRIWFQDNGIGITPKDQLKLFRLFERVHGSEYEGTGLGLAIVRKAVERMGGRVGVESEHGRGSKFWIELPAAP